MNSNALKQLSHLLRIKMALNMNVSHNFDSYNERPIGTETGSFSSHFLLYSPFSRFLNAIFTFE